MKTKKLPYSLEATPKLSMKKIRFATHLQLGAKMQMPSRQPICYGATSCPNLINSLFSI